jgi:hypothetical protein
MAARIRYKYKAIKKRSRTSAIINGNSKYSRQYIKGENVYAHGNTMGLMVFKNREDAQEWADGGYGLIVVRVLPIGRGKTVVAICSDTSTEGLDQFYSGKHSYYSFTPPDNTMAYPGVFVVD